MAVVCIGYPALVWFGLGHWSPRVLACVMLAVVVPAAVWRLRGSSREHLASLAILPVVTVVALSLAALLNSSGYVLMVPVVINLSLLVGFGSTLRPGARPMIERFARLESPELSEAKQAWCRLWTRIWCAFFVVNGGTALTLALAAPLSWWAFYTGLLSYGLMGVLFSVEWIVRRQRFGSTSTQLPDSGDVEP
ncbi:MAG: putative membrane protein [Pseudohongiellaceae bacterium]|jgi:uncharacterized membrane protein